MERPIIVGAQASQPNGVTIWRTIRQHLINNGVPMDYALFSSYEALDRALLDGAIDIAWNAPMAQAQTLLQSGGACRVLAMRDTDREVATIILTRADSGIRSPEDLRGKRLALGEPTSSEMSIIPLHQLRQAGLDVAKECEIVQFEPREHAGGERYVDVLAIIAGIEDRAADAATLFEPYFNTLIERKRLNPDAYRVVWRSRPFSHCGFAARPGLPEATGARFVEVLGAMDYDQPDIKEMMDLEHLRAWVPADESGWQDLIEGIKQADLVGKAY